MYQVILSYDSTNGRKYYYSYSETEDTNLGNISCKELPAYQDIKKARSCYWNEDFEAWVYDENKYAIYVAEAEAEKKSQAEAEAIRQATPSNYELNEATMELAGLVLDNVEAITEIGATCAFLLERVAALEGSV